MEPQLDTQDIQGHIFPGFGTSHSVVIALRLNSPPEARTALASLIPDVTTMESSLRSKTLRREAAISGLPQPEQQAPSLAISIAATGLQAWGHDTTQFDLSYRLGMIEDTNSLGDLVEDWQFATKDENRVDVLLVGGHSRLELLRESVERWLSVLEPHFSIILTEYGRRRVDDKEFFGFNDGVSQPAVRGLTPQGDYVSRREIGVEDERANLYAKPGQLLVWPGLFLFGYPRQGSDLTQPGAVMNPPATWMRNGSYLVFRRLRQDVRAFRDAVTKMEDYLTEQGEVVPEGWVAANLVGRWPDGTPLVASPNGPDRNVSGDPNRINNFRFFASFPQTPVTGSGVLPEVPADPLGIACPRVSHIRQVNPRDGISEIGQEHHPGKLMLRRGISFGPELNVAPAADRGLLFLSYQTSIVEQFKFVQTSWANATNRPTGDGQDPIIGQNGTSENQRTLRLFSPSGQQHRCPLDGRWVIATGGGYFFSPSIAGLKSVLIALDE